ncbi:MAG: TetR/AcrR family transcriptional regulator [Candidatus Lokiarchaeota archaeon]|nr:TetR/AcrR family transcriptional regulator [Candidatus Lokiarchaeota archaeon]
MSNKKFSRNKEEKIELIYETFFNLVLKKGYHKISTNHIAKTAKISIGTIYKYFPKGKEDIMRKYFETSMEEILNINDLIVINDDNIRSFLNRFIMDLYKNHEKKVGYNLALRSAIQADKQLLEAHKNKIELTFKEIAQHLRKKNNNFRQIPEEKLIEIFIFLYNLINAIIYHHLAIMKLFESSDRLVVYLSNLVAFSLDYLSKS